MVFNQRPGLQHRRGFCVAHDLYGVRIAHGQHGGHHRNRLSFKHQRPHLPCTDSLGRCTRRIKRHLRQVKHRRTHVHPHPAVSLHTRFDDAAQGLDHDRVFGCQPLLTYKLQKAARAVAALLDLAAVGVVDHVLKIDARPG